MTDLEYTKRHLSLAASVLDELITIVGHALPHCQPALVQLLNNWNYANNRLNAQEKSERKE